MKKVLKVMGIIVAVVVGLLVILLIYNWINHYKTLNKPRFDANYYKSFEAKAKLEEQYAGKGSYEVIKDVVESENKSMKNIRIWYPKELENSNEKYPMILIVNGSQTPAKVYEPFFERLSSWGFIVAGNDDPQAGTGATTSETLDYMIKLSELKDNIDMDHIGVAGYSQGGAGAICAVTNFQNSNLYKTIFTGSAAYPLLANNMGWAYDASRISIPYFMTAATGTSDDMGAVDINKEFAGICPLASLVEIFDTMSDDVLKVRGRFVGAEHEDMLVMTESYMTAWMLYQLKDDENAGKIFAGADAEIKNNSNWQDVEIRD